MRFRPRFTIRDLFWLTLVFAMAAGWLVNRHSWISRYGEYTIWHGSGQTVLIENATGRDWVRMGHEWCMTTDYPRPYNPAWF
jgi:hypothetical protein